MVCGSDRSSLELIIGVIDDMAHQLTQSDISFYLSIQDLFIIYSIPLR